MKAKDTNSNLNLKIDAEIKDVNKDAFNKILMNIVSKYDTLTLDELCKIIPSLKDKIFHLSISEEPKTISKEHGLYASSIVIRG